MKILTYCYQVPYLGIYIKVHLKNVFIHFQHNSMMKVKYAFLLHVWRNLVLRNQVCGSRPHSY